MIVQVMILTCGVACRSLLGIASGYAGAGSRRTWPTGLMPVRWILFEHLLAQSVSSQDTTSDRFRCMQLTMG